jgi:hypothetical protein
LTTLVDDHALDPDDLRAFASLPIQRVEHVGHAPGKVRAILPQLRRHFGRLIVHHSPAKALHGAKVHRHRLRGQHAFDFVGRLERPQGRDRGEHLLIASFVCLARRKPAGSGHRVDQHAVKLVAPRSAECAQFVGFGFVDEDVSRRPAGRSRSEVVVTRVSAWSLNRTLEWARRLGDWRASQTRTSSHR